MHLGLAHFPQNSSHASEVELFVCVCGEDCEDCDDCGEVV